MFADDAALIAHNHEDIQQMTKLFAEAATAFGLGIDMRKTEVLYQPSKLDSQPHSYAKMAASTLATISRFTYLGSTVTTDAKLDVELQIHWQRPQRASVDSMMDYGETRMLPTK